MLEQVVLILFRASQLQQQILVVKMKEEQCSICSSEELETRLILARLRTRIVRQSQEYVPNYKEEPGLQHSDGLARLLLLIFGRTANFPSISQCQHYKFSRYFRRKLKCDNRTFNLLCAQLASKLAEKKYHLEVLTLQLGSIADTAVRETNHPLTHVVARAVQEEAQGRKSAAETRLTLKRPSVQRVETPFQQLPPRVVPGMEHNYGSHPYWMSAVFPYPWQYQGPQGN